MCRRTVGPPHAHSHVHGTDRLNVAVDVEAGDDEVLRVDGQVVGLADDVIADGEVGDLDVGVVNACVVGRPGAPGILAPCRGAGGDRGRKEYGGKIAWILQSYPSKKDKLTGIKRSIEAGADAIYIQGGVGDRLVEAGEMDLIDEVVRFVQAQGLPVGVGGHALETPKACEKAGLQPDFYVKTLHSHDYWSARRPDQTASVIHDRHDNFWCADPKATIEFMKGVKRPWIAFKVMAAGAIHPRAAFSHAFAGGADFVLAGMFDWQIAEDVRIAKTTLAKVKRARPWRS